MRRLPMSEGDKVTVELADNSRVDGTINRVFINRSGYQGARVQLDNKLDAYGSVISAFVGPKPEVVEKIVAVK